MKNHYIPRLLIKRFAEKDKVNVYDYIEDTFTTKKLRDAFWYYDNKAQIAYERKQ